MTERSTPQQASVEVLAGPELRSEHIEARQAEIRGTLAGFLGLPAENFPVAVAVLAVTPDAHVKTIVLNVEQEHAAPLIDAARGLAIRLHDFAAPPGGQRRAKVVKLPG